MSKIIKKWGKDDRGEDESCVTFGDLYSVKGWIHPPCIVDIVVKSSIKVPKYKIMLYNLYRVLYSMRW